MVRKEKMRELCKPHGFLLLPVFYFYSYVLISAYTAGDQTHYRLFYAALEGTDLSQVMILSKSYLGSVEPLPGALLWVGSNLGMEKDIFISFLNLILLLGVFFLCRKYRTSLVVLFLMLTNFYVIVLMTGAERLKIAYIIIIWAAVWGGKKGTILTGISPFAHLQNFILFPSLLLSKAFEPLKHIARNGTLKKRLLWHGGFVVVAFVIIVGLLSKEIFVKALMYLSKDISLFEFVNLFILSVIAFVATKNRWRMVLVLIPMYPAVFLLGGMRVNMIAVTLTIYFLMKEHALNHPAVLMLLFYFSIKSIPFVNRIFLYGNGFSSSPWF